MSRHRVGQDLFGIAELADPGNAGKIAVERSPCFVPLASAAAETRTVLNPTRAGAILVLHCRTYVGDIVVTFSTAMSEDGATTFTFTEVGQFALFVSLMDSAGAFFWRKVADYSTGNLSPADLAPLAAFSGLTASVAELNQAADESVNTEIVITTNVITAAESGATFYLDLAAGFTSTLPAPALGMRFRFIVKTAPTGAPYVINTPTANIIYGMFEERAGGAGVAGAAQDTVNLVHNQAIIGDWAEFYSDGTNWYVHGMVDVAAGVTFAVT